MIMKKKHIHRWRKRGCNSKVIYYNCRCGAQKERLATTKESKAFNVDFRKQLKRSDALHRIFHNFCKRFKNGDEYVKNGYPLMYFIEKWAKRFPNHVQVVRCDDNVHAGSDLVLIEHSIPGEYWGTTVIFVSQFEPPTEFFLYPGHQKQLMTALKKIDAHARVANREK